MAKRVGIVTINDYTNYGNRYQNYALTRLLENEGYTVVNGIDIHTKEGWVNKTRSTAKRLLKKAIPFSYYKQHIYRPGRPLQGLKVEREKNFRAFISSYTTLIEPVMTSTYQLARKQIGDNKIDYYIVGSDQVWNPHFRAKDGDFLLFTDPKKRLSFAASIGVERIPENLQWYYKKNLAEMKYISVREDRAAQIIQDLIEKDVEVTPDPTLLIDHEEWIDLAKQVNLELPEHYIATYFLGEIPKVIQEFSTRTGLPLVQLNNEDFPDLYICDPFAFLNILNRAQYILTDSFHGTALSIKLHKEFYVFKREGKKATDMFSRIETVTKTTGLERRIQNRDRVEIEHPITSANWDKIDKYYKAQKEKAMVSLNRIMTDEASL